MIRLSWRLGSNPRVQLQTLTVPVLVCYPNSTEPTFLFSYISASSLLKDLDLRERQMAMTSFSCSLNQLPPPAQSSGPSSPSKTNQVQLAWNKSDGGSWGGRCVVGMACVMVGLEMGGLVSGQSHEAIAKGMTPLVMESSEKVAKWSDKRMCPKWRANELETIVPENLPRPSAHRRWEIVGFNTRDAPAVKTIARRSSGGCFSM